MFSICLTNNRVTVVIFIMHRLPSYYFSEEAEHEMTLIFIKKTARLYGIKNTWLEDNDELYKVTKGRMPKMG